MVSEPLVPTEDVPQGLHAIPLERMVDLLDVTATTIAEVHGVAVVMFQFHPGDPHQAWPFPIFFAGRPDDLRRMGRMVNTIAHRAANLAEGAS